MIENMITDLVWTLSMIPVGVILLVGVVKVLMSRM